MNIRFFGYLLCLSVIALAGCAGVKPLEETRELKVLTIGNSFSQSAEFYMPQAAASLPGCKLKFCSLYIGGCPLDRHWECVVKSAADPSFKPYHVHTQFSYKNEPLLFYASLNEIVTGDRWDIITIQQASRKSIDYALYQPYADKLIKFLKDTAPQAEIVIQQTWSYRSDSASLDIVKVSPKEMYEKLDAAYRKLAQKHNLRIIPMGYAVELYRRYTKDKVTPVTPEVLKNLKYPQELSCAGDVVGYPRWINPDNPKKRYFLNDTTHFNPRGRYMQSCLWAAFFFNRSAFDIKYDPDWIDADEIKLLKKCIDEALKTYPQVK